MTTKHDTLRTVALPIILPARYSVVAVAILLTVLAKQVQGAG